jgi:DNA repair exonuclease SbcCD ATPase subunit
MADFDILIGVDMSQAESDIKSSIDRIGKQYPVKLHAVITNESEIKGKLEGLTKLIKNLQTIDINFGLSDDAKMLKAIEQAIEKISKKDFNIGKGLTDSFDEAQREAKELQKDIDAVKNSFERLMKLQRKVNNQDGSSKTITKTGNQFMNKTVVHDTTDRTKPEKLTTEYVKDQKAFDDYMEKAYKKVEGMKRVSSLLADDFNELNKKLESMKVLFKENSTSFDSEFREVNRLINAYEELEKTLQQRNKLLDQAEKKFKNADLNLIPQKDREALEKEINTYRTRANNVKGGDMPFALFTDEDVISYVDRINSRVKELSDINSDLKQKQSELVKYQEKLSETSEKWRKNGHLTNEEVDEFEKSFKSLDIYSEKFADNLQNVQREFNRLVEKEKQIKAEKLDHEKALEKIAKERMVWEQRVADVEREGLAHYKSIEKLKRLVNELDKQELRTLQQVDQKLE